MPRSSRSKSTKKDSSRDEEKLKVEKLRQDLTSAREWRDTAKDETEKDQAQQSVDQLEDQLDALDEPMESDHDDGQGDANDAQEVAEQGGAPQEAGAPQAGGGVSPTGGNVPDTHQADDMGVRRVKEENDEVPLFRRSESGAESDDVKGEVDEDGHEALFVRHIPKLSETVETVGWGKAKTGFFFINRYGKKGASKHRIEQLAESAEYEERVKSTTDPNKVTNSENRYGDKKLPSGDWRYTKRHIIGIWGVAWGSPVGCRDDLELINPAAFANKDGAKWPDTYVLVMWEIDGERKKAWETRSCLRNRWTKKGADAAIYQAACEAEDRYIEAKTGTRPAKSRSPTHGLAEETAAHFRAQSLGVPIGRNATPQPGTYVHFMDTLDPAIKNRAFHPNVNTLAEALESFKISYGELYGKEFREMDINEKEDMTRSWEVRKRALLAQ